MIDVLEVLGWILAFLVGIVVLAITSIRLEDEDRPGIVVLMSVVGLGCAWLFAVGYAYPGDTLAMWEWIWRVWLALLWAGVVANLAIYRMGDR